jgi:hypothetical protein
MMCHDAAPIVEDSMRFRSLSRPPGASAVTAALALGLALGLAAPQAQAKPISGDQLGRALEICIVQGGSTFDFGESWGCCLRTPPPPFCVICEGEPAYGKTCDISSARSGRPPKGANLGGGDDKLDQLLDLLPSDGKAVVDPGLSTINP